MTKTVRLAGGFKVVCSEEKYQALLDEFISGVKIGLSGIGLQSFIDSYLDSLITYGNAAGEIVISRDGESIAGLCNLSPERIEVKEGKNPLEPIYFIKNNGFSKTDITKPLIVPQNAILPPKEQFLCVARKLCKKSCRRQMAIEIEY